MGIKFLLMSVMVLMVSSCQLTSSPKAESDSKDVSIDIEVPLSDAVPSGEYAEMANRIENHSIGEAQVFELINYLKSDYVRVERANVFTYDTMKVLLKVNDVDLDDISHHDDGFHNMVFDRDSASKPRSYSLDDSFDMGDFDLWLFSSKYSNVIIVELYDYYSSVFFAYVLVGERLFRIGDFEVLEPEVEDVGIQKKEIEVVWDGEKFILTTFLGGVEDGVFEFELADAIEQKIIN